MKKIYLKLLAGLCLTLAGVLFILANSTSKSAGANALVFEADSVDEESADGDGAADGGSAGADSSAGEADSDDAADGGAGDEADGGEASATKAQSLLTVHVCGEVVSPGVYMISDGSRYIDAIEAAGGFTDAASQISLNLASFVSDGEQIIVPSAAEYESQSAAESVKASEAEQSLIDINTADATELKKLSGIGDARAAAIISYRERNGPFGSISDIKNVDGVGESLYEKIKDYIKVD